MSSEELDPVFQDENGMWNFWDDKGTFFYGPYLTEDLARKAYMRYSQELEGK